MSAHRAGADASDGVVVVGLEAHDDTGVETLDDGLDLGRPPRPPMSRRTRRWLVGAGAALVAGAVTVVLLVRPGADTTSPQAATTPAVESTPGFAAGPLLVSVGGHDALQPAGLPGLGAARDPVLLEPAPDVVAVLTATLPNFRDVRGGRVPEDVGGPNGIYVTGRYDGMEGAPVDLTVYSVRAPGTTYGSDQFVSHVRTGQDIAVRTDVSVFTGSGWWVHVIGLGPDAPVADRGKETARLLALASDPRLVTTT